MATYVTLYTFTDQGIRNVKDSPDRLAEGIRVFEQSGGEILGAYYLEGTYDLVVISRHDDDRTAAAFALAQAARGNVRSMTMRAFSKEEFEEVLRRMP